MDSMPNALVVFRGTLQRLDGSCYIYDHGQHILTVLVLLKTQMATNL
jgi:hypothetical protein